MMRGVVLAALLAASGACMAQSAVGGYLLGLTDTELQAAVPDVQRLRKTVPGPRGLRGNWETSSTRLHGLPFPTTFYVRDQRVQRIEQLWRSNTGLCTGEPVFAAISSDMDSRYGAGMTSGEEEDLQQSSVWQAGAFDVIGYFTRSPGPCTIRLVYQWHVVKDASAL